MYQPPVYQPPDFITIRTPMHELRNRGKLATGERYGRNLKVRVSYTDRQLIEHVSNELNMSIAGFIRWCSIRAAHELLKDIEKVREGSDQ